MEKVTLNQQDIDAFNPNQLSIVTAVLGLREGELVPGTYDAKNNYNRNLVNTQIIKKPTSSVMNDNSGVSGGAGLLDPKIGALAPFINQATQILDSVYASTSEPTQREKDINMGRAALKFFTTLGAKSSVPGATALGAANQAGALVAQDYLNAETKRESDAKKLAQAKKSTALSLGMQLKSAKDAKDIATRKIKSEVVPLYKVGEGVTGEKIKNVIKGSSEYIKLTTIDKTYSTVKPDMGTIKEDEFGVQFFIGGKHDGKRVRDVFNEDKIKKGENVDTETEDDAGNIVSTEPTLLRLTKTQHTQAKDFRKSIMDQTKDYRDDIEPGFRKILQFFNDQDPIGDYALAVGFAKMIDPGSVAKEGEVRAVQKSGSLPEELKAQLINALTGQGPLPPRVRAGIVNRAIDIYNSERQKVTSVIERVSKSWASQIERTDQQGHIVHFDVGEEYKGEKIDLSTLPESSNQPFVFDEGAVKQLSIPQLTALFQQNLTQPQIKFVLEVLKEKKKRGK